MAYPNCTINESGIASFQVDSSVSSLPIYTRVKFSTNTDSSNAAKPTLLIAGASDRAIGVAMQAGVASQFITVRLLNAPGEAFAISSGTNAVGNLCYAAANGAVAATGSIIAGVVTSNGYNGGPCTIMQLLADS